MADEIDVLESADSLSEEIPCCSYTRVPEPIVIRGVGRLTIFGLSSRFDTEFPPTLIGKLAPEEWKGTIQRVNFIIEKKMRMLCGPFFWLIFGAVFCCCTFSCSFWPVICLNRRTIVAINKTLDFENQQLYNKLGLRWRLSRRPVENNSRLTEYVLLLESLPRLPLMQPD